MGEEPRAPEPQVGATSADEDRSPERIRAEIDQTREDMGDTVDALAAKTDVKGQAQQRIADLKGNLDRRRQELTAKARSTTPESAQQSGQQVVAKVRENPAPVALGGAVLAGFLLGRLTGRR